MLRDDLCRYVELHRDQFPPHIPSDFTGYDVATVHIGDGPPAARRPS